MPAGLTTCSCPSTLEHQPDPCTMLQAIYRNLDDDGMGLITVPSFEYIMDHNGYYELIRDHIAYYTFDTLAALLENNGFQVLECEMVNRDTLSMIVKSARSWRRGIYWRICGTAPRDGHLPKVSDGVEEKGGDLGGGHQGFTLAATTKLGKKAEYIIDSAPFKQGRFAPASHLPIVAPDYFLSTRWTPS